MKLREAILQGNPRAVAAYCDKLRAHGANYDDSYRAVCRIFEAAGKEPPDLGTFDSWLYEVDTDQARA